MNIIRAIVIDGFHRGHCVSFDYRPTIRLLKPRIIKVDYCCNGDEILDNPTVEYIEYRECFRAVDNKTVLYSLTGDSAALIQAIPRWYSDEPWSDMTTLYMGYHSEPIVRVDSVKPPQPK